MGSNHHTDQVFKEKRRPKNPIKFQLQLNEEQKQAKDLIPSLSGISQDNMTRSAKEYGITWGDMMVFDNNEAINVIARSKEQVEDGKYVYFDKYGYGQGGGTTTFEGPDYTVV